MASGSKRTGRDIIITWLRNGLFAVVLGTALAYVVDYAVLRLRVSTGKAPFGTVNVRPVYAVPQKDHRTEYLVGDAQDQPCVHSLFPHMGDSPCWYLERHREQRVDM